MKNKIESKIKYLVVGTVLVGSLLAVGTTFAAGPVGGMMGRARMPGVFGTVSAINGNTLTVTSKGFGQNTTATTYTVDATNALVTKVGVSSSVSSIAVGDMVMVAGTVNGTSVVATTIRDGVIGKPKTPPVSIIKGNGQPVIGGAVTAISGNTLTVTNKSNVTYTVDATNATVEKSNVLSSVSAIAVGDNVVVQGMTTGNSVTASSVIDGGATATTTGAHKGGFFGTIGNFFHNLFGFF